MSDTCIVCLGDLSEGAPEPALAAVFESLPRPPAATHDGGKRGGRGGDGAKSLPQRLEDDEPGRIAQLLPCGHILHNDCLKPWVERANSCPICRQSFNVVELTETFGGPVVTSYCVQDRVQTADIDPSMVIDEVTDDSDSQPCPICGDDDNEEVLLLCDGCDVASHTYCVGLDAIPSGAWFCAQCEAQRAVSSEPARPHNRPNRRTRGDQRRNRSRNQMNAMNWARVWQSVWDQLNLDLDFPFDDEDAAERALQRTRQEASERRDFRAWERRFRIAQRQGGANMFRDTAPALLEMRRGWPSRPRPRIESPEPESLDEVRAWNAFERAREIQDVTGSNPLKRKSPTASPAEPAPAQPERKLKRPRTRRPEDLADRRDRGESSRAGESGASRTRVENGVSGPSFLQSLLKEVEDSSAPSRTNGTFRSSIGAPASTDLSSPGPSSPALSPMSSNRSSPRPSSTTPPPPLPHSNNNRPTSPTSVASDPIFSSPEFSPTCSPAQPPRHDTQTRLPRQLTRTRTRTAAHSSASSPSRLHSDDASSPTRGGLSLPIKSALQKMVSTALKPHYRSRLVSKDEYTDINRRISRMLYELVGPTDVLDSENNAKWQRFASDEVDKTITHLKEAKSHEASDSSGAASS